MKEGKEWGRYKWDRRHLKGLSTIHNKFEERKPKEKNACDLIAAKCLFCI
jgi:hypothetical protein